MSSTMNITFLALQMLSMDRAQESGGLDNSSTSSLQQQRIVATIELPASYGRLLPISEEEISAINVSAIRVTRT